MSIGRLLLRSLWPARDPVGLGKLEREVMGLLWKEDRPVTVRDVQDRLSAPLAYTTVMTTLDRLFRKKLLVRQRSGRAFIYSTAMTQTQLECGLVVDLVKDLLDPSAPAAEAILSGIVEVVDERDRRLLDVLDRLVQQRRQSARKQR